MEITKEAQVLAAEAESMLERYQAYSVISNESLVLADEDLTKIKEKLKQIDETRKSMTKPLDTVKKTIMDFFKPPTEMLNQARESINTAMSGYRSEQEKIRQEQEAKLREIARKEEEKQKKILADKIARAEASGKDSKVEELKAKEVFVPVPVVQSSVVETKNKPRDVWKFRIKDPLAIPKEYMIADEVKIGQVIRATKGSLQIPGIEIYSENSKF